MTRPRLDPRAPASLSHVGLAHFNDGREPDCDLETVAKPEEPQTSVRAARRQLKPAALYEEFCQALSELHFYNGLDHQGGQN